MNNNIKYCNSFTNYSRFKTREINIGGHNLGNSAIELDDGYLIVGALNRNSALIKLDKETGSTIFSETYNYKPFSGKLYILINANSKLDCKEKFLKAVAQAFMNTSKKKITKLEAMKKAQSWYDGNKGAYDDLVLTIFDEDPLNVNLYSSGPQEVGGRPTSLDEQDILDKFETIMGSYNNF